MWQQDWSYLGIELCARYSPPFGFQYLIKGYPGPGFASVAQNPLPGGFPSVLFTFALSPTDRFPYGEDVDPDH